MAITAIKRNLVQWRNTRRAIRANVSYGNGFRTGINSTFWAPRSLTIGEDVLTGSDTRIEVDGEIGDSVLMGNSVAIIGRRDHRYDEIGVPVTRTTRVVDQPNHLSDPVSIGSDVWIGFGAIILSGLSIGDHSIVGAGSLVTSDVPPNTIVAGHPATIIKRRFSDADLETHREGLRARGVRLSMHRGPSD